MVKEFFRKADAFASLYRSFEFALKRTTYENKSGKLSKADWPAFAGDLGGGFFTDAVKSAKAKMLIEEPPGILLKGVNWTPAPIKPLSNVEQLFVNGVCQVRHNFEHGEKQFATPEQLPRNLQLVTEALWVLGYALERRPDIGKMIQSQQ